MLLMAQKAKIAEWGMDASLVSSPLKQVEVQSSRTEWSDHARGLNAVLGEQAFRECGKFVLVLAIKVAFALVP